MPGRRAIAAFLIALVMAASASLAHALDRAGAIEVARKQLGSQCGRATFCTFDATLHDNKWHVRVEVVKPDSPNDKRGKPAIFVIDQTGRIVGRIEGK